MPALERSLLFSAKPGQPACWVYCGDGRRLPPAFEVVIALVKRSSTGHYNTVAPAHYQVAFDGSAKDSGWFVFERRISSQVVAWLYIPKDVEISKEKMEQLIKLGELVL